MAKIPKGSVWFWPIIVLLIAFGSFYLKPWQQKPTETISVTAQGKAQARPDIAKITATIESKNPSLDAARAENEQKVTNLVTKLKALGIGDKDIKTQNISGGPGYEIQIYPPIRPNTNQFSTSLEITIHNFDQADAIISLLTQNGATNLYGPSLTLSTETLEKTRSQARQKAVEQARQKAQELAKLSSRSLGKVITIKEENEFTPVPLLVQNTSEIRQKADSLTPGQNEVVINIQVDFALQ